MNMANYPIFSGAKSAQGQDFSSDTVSFKDIHKMMNMYMLTFSQVVRPFSSNSANPIGINATQLTPNTLWDLLAPRDSQNNPVNMSYENIALRNTGEAFVINSDGLAISPSRFVTDNNRFILNQAFTNATGYLTAKEKVIKLD